MTDAAVAGGPWAPIHRPALQDEVLIRIRRMIEDGTLLPGNRIPERQLCEQLGVSRTPLREAFRVLGAQGLIELKPRRGAVVRRLNAVEIDHMFEVLEVLEGLAAELACDVMGEEALAGMEKLHVMMMAAFRRRDRAGFFDLNQRVHEGIVKASGNSVLARVYEGLSGQVRRIRYMPKITDAQWREAAEQHSAIMKAIQQRDRKAAARAVRGHIRTKRERVKAFLAL